MSPVTWPQIWQLTLDDISPQRSAKERAISHAISLRNSPHSLYQQVNKIPTKQQQTKTKTVLEVDELPPPVQDQLFTELLDKDAQEQLESDPAVINWSLELTVRLGSRLYALWNRSAGDCLLDSVMQATWGVFDRDNTLRRALAESLSQGGHV